MTTTANWETVEVPAGSFIGWGNTPGQTVIGKVLSFDPVGGTDYNGGACPELGLELLEAAASYNKAGERFDFAAGELVNITCGGANLKRSILAAQLSVGDLVKIVLDELKPLNGGKTVKLYSVSVARGAGATAAAPAPAQAQPAPAPAADSPAPGFTPEQWAGLTDAAKTAIRAQQQ